MNGMKAHKKTFNIVSHLGNINENCDRYHDTPTRMTKILKSDKAKGCEASVTLLLWCGIRNDIIISENSLLISYINIHLPYDPGFSVLGIFQRGMKMKTSVHRKTCTLFIIAAFKKRSPKSNTTQIDF